MLPILQQINNNRNDDSRTSNYPKSLSILINTRIRGYPKIKYEPSMSIPGVKSETVYFDPLIKLNRSVAGSVPKGYPPSELYTQFFDKGAFESLLSRTLSSSFFGQGKKTIEQATEDGYIDNNINITLNQLFKSGNIFYIKGQPFTIHDYDWNYGDWQIGTKNIERKFETSPGTYGQGINSLIQFQFSREEEMAANAELQNFESSHPSFVMRGKVNPKYSKFGDGEGGEFVLTGVAEGVKNTGTNANGKPISTNVATSEEIQAQLPSPVVELLGKDYVAEPALNLDAKTPIMQSDPISLSIIYYLDRNYSQDTNKNPKLKALYDTFFEARNQYKVANEKFNVLLGSENKSPDALQTKKQEFNALRNDLLQNKEKILNFIEPFNSRYSQLTRQIDNTLSNGRTPQNPQNLKNLEPLIKIFTQKNELISSKLDVKNGGNLEKLLPNQIELFKLLKEIAQLLNDVNTAVSDTRNSDTDMQTQMQTQMQLQELKKNVQQQQRLIIELSNALKKENYDFLLPKMDETAVLYIKADFDKLLNNFYDLVKKYNENNTTFQEIIDNANLKSQMINAVNNIFKLRNNFLEASAKTLTAFLEKTRTQEVFIKSFVELYTELHDFKKKQLETLVKEKTTPIDKIKEEIAVKLINFDTLCYNSLLQSDKTIQNQNIKKAIERLMYQVREPMNSIEELQKYYENRSLLMIEKYQYNIYYQQILLFNENNEESMWSVLSNMTNLFFHNFKEYTFKEINTTYTLYKRYNDTYSPGERAAFLTRLKMSDKPIQKQSLLAFASLSKDKDKAQRELYLKMINHQVICYDLISLYAKLTTIDLSRTISYLTVKKNVLKIQKIMTREFDSYYRRIKGNIDFINGLIPNPIFWSIANIDELIDIKLAENEQKKNNVDYAIINIDREVDELQNSYTNALDLLLPQLTNIGLLKTCYNITDAELEEAEAEAEDTEYLLTNAEIEKKFFSEFLANVDAVETEICKQQFMTAIKEQINDGSAPGLTPLQITSLLQNWKISWNKNRPNDSLFYTVATALNGQLIVTQKLSLNPYTEPSINGLDNLREVFNSKFTANSLRRCISENIRSRQIDDYKERSLAYIKKIENYLDMPTDTRENRQRKSEIELLLKKQWELLKFIFINRNFDQVSLAIRNNRRANPVDYNFIQQNNEIIRAAILDQNLYFGDDITIEVFEEVFKIKFITVNKKQGFKINEKNLLGKSIYFRKQTDKNKAEDVVQVYVSSLNENGIAIAETFDYQQYQFNITTSNRFLGLEQPFYNVNIYENSNVVMSRNMVNSDWDYLFILSDEINGKTVYKNIYNFSDRKFLYKFEEIPSFLYYLIFRFIMRSRSIAKYRQSAFAFFNENMKFRSILQEYSANMLAKREETSRRRRSVNLRENLNRLSREQINALIEQPVEYDGDVVQSGGAISGGAPNVASRFVNVNRGNSVFASNKDSRLSYYIIIDLELYPGKNGIPMSQKAVLACQNRYEKIRQAWAKLFGLVYRPNELYVTGFTAPTTLKYTNKNAKTRKKDRRRRNRSERYER